MLRIGYSVHLRFGRALPRSVRSIIYAFTDDNYIEIVEIPFIYLNAIITFILSMAYVRLIQRWKTPVIIKALLFVVGKDLNRVRRLCSVPSISFRRSGPGIITTNRRYATENKIGRLYDSMETPTDGEKVCLTWIDGEASTYHAVWLRHNCRCSQCWHDVYAAPLV